MGSPGSEARATSTTAIAESDSTASGGDPRRTGESGGLMRELVIGEPVERARQRLDEIIAELQSWWDR